MALKHPVTDTDNNFSINPVTRAIKNESVNKTLLVQYDHNSERFSFEIPKVVEGHEMDKCDKIEIHFVNIDAKTQQQSRGVYEVPKAEAQVSDQDDSMLVFSWLISQAATKYVGSLNFLVRFTCLADDNVTPIYVWNTAIFSGIMVSNGLYNTDFVMEDYCDALEQWKYECTAIKLMNLAQTQFGSKENGGENIWTATFDNLGEHYEKQFKVKDGTPGTPGKSAYQMVKEAGLFSGTEDEFMERLMYPEFYEDDIRLKKVTFQLSDSELNIITE